MLASQASHIAPPAWQRQLLRVTCWLLQNIRWELMHDTWPKRKRNAPFFDSNALCAGGTKLLSQVRQHHEQSATLCCKDLILLGTLWCLFNTTVNIFQTFNFSCRKLLIAAAEPAFNSLHVASSGPVAKMNSSQRPSNWLHRLPTNGNQVGLLSAAGVRCVHIWLSSTALSIRHSAYVIVLRFTSFLKNMKFESWKNSFQLGTMLEICWSKIGAFKCWESWTSLAGIFQPKNAWC